MKFWHVDAFAKKAFQGNPAAVFILDKPISDELMQNIATEMNLAETAYVLLREGKKPLLRWFTPVFEIDLCGHATLASACIYLTKISPKLDEVTFDTKYVGPLKVTQNSDGFTMNFPSRLGEKINLEEIPEFVLTAISKEKPVVAYKSRDLMLVYENEKIIREINPDFNALMKYNDFIIVTAQSNKSNRQQYDFVSRFFCANDVVVEDPVTGSAHCTLAPYWAKKLNKHNLKAFQASKRGGALSIEVNKDQVNITGHAVIVMKGIIDIDFSKDCKKSTEQQSIKFFEPMTKPTKNSVSEVRMHSKL